MPERPKHDVDKFGLSVDPTLRRLELSLCDLACEFALNLTDRDKRQLIARRYQDTLDELYALGWDGFIDVECGLPDPYMPKNYPHNKAVAPPSKDDLPRQPKHEVDEFGLPIAPALRRLEMSLYDLVREFPSRWPDPVGMQQVTQRYEETLEKMYALGWDGVLDEFSMLPAPLMPKNYPRNRTEASPNEGELP